MFNRFFIAVAMTYVATMLVIGAYYVALYATAYILKFWGI